VSPLAAAHSPPYPRSLPCLQSCHPSVTTCDMCYLNTVHEKHRMRWMSCPSVSLTTFYSSSTSVYVSNKFNVEYVQ
jgi:hypothetical protein